MFSFNATPSAKDEQPLFPVPKTTSRSLGKTGRRVDHFPEDTLYSEEEDYSDDYEYDTFEDASLSTKSNNTNAPLPSNAPPTNICHPAPNRPLEPYTNSREDLVALGNYFGFARGDVVRNQQQRAHQVVQNLPPVPNHVFAISAVNQAVNQQNEKEIFLQLQMKAQNAVTAYGNAMLTEFSTHRVVDPCRVMLQLIFSAAQACQAMPAFDIDPDIHEFMGALSQRILFAKKSLDDGRVEEEIDYLELEITRTSPTATSKKATARAKAPAKTTAKKKSETEPADDASEYRATGRGARGRGSRGGARGGAQGVRRGGRKRTTTKLNDAASESEDEESKVLARKPYSGSKDVLSESDDESDEDDLPKKVSHAKSKAPPKRETKKAQSSSSSSEELESRKPALSDGPPKRAINAFMTFIEEKRPEYRTNFPEASLAELTQMMGNAWKNMAEEDKPVYQKRADADKERYIRELQLWESSREKAKMPVKLKGKKCASSSSASDSEDHEVPIKKIATPVKSVKSKAVKLKEKKPLRQQAAKKHDAKAASSEEEKAPKEKLASPLRPMSAYMIYMNAKRPEFKERNPDASLPELSRLIGAAWKDLPNEEKDTYVAQANADRERYNRENALWGASLQSHAPKPKASKKKISLESDSEDDSDEESSSASESKSDESDESSAEEAKTKKMPVKTRKTKDPNAPKLPLTAFFFHVGEKREQLKNDHPEWSFTQVTKQLAELWKDMPESEKAIFQAKANADRERYTKEKAEYEAYSKNQGKKI